MIDQPTVAPRTTALLPRVSPTFVPSPLVGALAGVIATLTFMIIHAITILGIWFSLAPMLLAGAACGFCLAWSYAATSDAPSTRRWLTFNGMAVVLLFVLGGISFVLFEPRVTMAQLLVADDPLGDVIPPALPLMLLASIVGTIVMWVSFGRRRAAVVPIAISQFLLMFLLGHNFAILGLVEMSAAAVPMLGTFMWLTILLAATFSATALALARVVQVVGSRTG